MGIQYNTYTKIVLKPLILSNDLLPAILDRVEIL